MSMPPRHRHRRNPLGRAQRPQPLRLRDARCRFLSGDIDAAVDIFAGALARGGSAVGAAEARAALGHILGLLDRMAGADPEFGRARETLRARARRLLAIP